MNFVLSSSLKLVSELPSFETCNREILSGLEMTLRLVLVALHKFPKLKMALQHLNAMPALYKNQDDILEQHLYYRGKRFSLYQGDFLNLVIRAKYHGSANRQILRLRSRFPAYV